MQESTKVENCRREADCLQAALAAHARGWSIIPISAGTKKPTCKWTKYQTERATELQLRKWFGNGQDVGLAVVFGPASGGLVCRDFDVQEAYDKWAAHHSDLASILPTVATARGRHVYCCSNHRGIKKLDDGELRGAGYCLLPPSRHPDGPVYEWLIPPPDGEMPYVADVHAAGFLPTTHVTESTETTENTEEDGSNLGSLCTLGSLCCKGDANGENIDPIERAVVESLPFAMGRRNRQVFELARALKAIPTLADAPVDALQPHVRHWHSLGVAKGVIGTEPFTETWIDFFTCWPKVRFPKGSEPMVLILERAKQSPPPKAAERYDQAELRLLVVLCRELQQAAGVEPFYLSCRTAAELLDVRNKQGGFDHVKAWRWLLLLAHDGIVAATEKGNQSKHRATRYRYTGD